MDEEVLINMVRRYRALYDVNHSLYQDQLKRETAWQEIAKRLELPVQECRERWKRLRENYVKAKKHRHKKKLQGATKLKPIKHQKAMSFLDSLDENDGNEPTDSMKYESDTGSSTGVFQEKQEDVSNISMDTVAFDRPYLDETVSKCDTVVSFFTNLGETVKTFPEEVQIRVKRDIFKIINDTEEEVLNMKRCGGMI